MQIIFGVGTTVVFRSSSPNFFWWVGETLYLMIFLVSNGDGIFSLSYFPFKLNSGSLSCV